MRPVSPKIAVLVLYSLTVTASYFGDLAVTACLRFTAVAGLSGNLLVWVGTGKADRRQRLGAVERQQR